MPERDRWTKLENRWLQCQEPQAAGVCNWCGTPIDAGEEFAELDNEGAVCLECIEGLSGRELIEALSAGVFKILASDGR